MRLILPLVVALLLPAAAGAAKEPSLRAVAKTLLKSGQNHNDRVGRFSSAYTPGIPAVMVQRSSVSRFRIKGMGVEFVGAKGNSEFFDRPADRGDAGLAQVAVLTGKPRTIKSKDTTIQVRQTANEVSVDRQQGTTFLITPTGGVGRALKRGESAHDAYKATYGKVDPTGNAWARSLDRRYEAAKAAP